MMSYSDICIVFSYGDPVGMAFAQAWLSDAGGVV
jgi:hypothetical protein